MIFTQVFDIPASRQITLPSEAPTGRANIFIVPVQEGVNPLNPRLRDMMPPEGKIPKRGCHKGKIWMADDFNEPLDDFKDYMQMERYLLDTCTAIWFFEDNPALSVTADSIINDRTKVKYISIASAWEIAIKINIKKLDFAGGVKEFLHLAEENGFIIAPIYPDHLSTLESLPIHHRDPFDRLLIATAIAEEMTLITDDKNISLYEVNHIW